MTANVIFLTFSVVEKQWSKTDKWPSSTTQHYLTLRPFCTVQDQLVACDLFCLQPVSTAFPSNPYTVSLPDHPRFSLKHEQSWHMKIYYWPMMLFAHVK